MKGTEDMPEPQTMNYDQMIKISQKFVDEVMSILTNQPYVEVNDMVKAIMDSKYVLPISVVNEIIQRVAKYPYHVVKNFMETVETNQGAYFSAAQTKPVEETAQSGQPEQEQQEQPQSTNTDETE